MWPTGAREIQRCANGITATGAGTADNFFGNFIHITECSQAGLRFTEAARRNRFERGTVRRCGLGIHIDGSSTDDNVVLDVLVSDSASDGVRFSGGCQFNQLSGVESPDPTQSRFRTTWIGKNRGNSVTMTGAVTSGNLVVRSLLGVSTLPFGPGADDGYGIEVRDGASENLFVDCVVADHRLSGVHLHGIGTRQNRFENLLVFGGALLSGHGVLIDGGAQDNVFLRGEIGPNRRDGVRLLGANTSGNVFSGLLVSVGKTEVPLLRHFPIKRVINGIVQLQFLTNLGAGIHIENATSNRIGTPTGPGNTLSKNQFDGVRITGPQAVGNRLLGNFIGTDDTGTQRLPNGLQGVIIDGEAHNNEVGGPRIVRHPFSPDLLLAPNPRHLGGANLIAANALSGVRLAGSGTRGNRILGNIVDWEAGTQTLGNGGDGITIAEGASDTCVGNCFSFGADDPGLANVIRRNNGAGILMVGAASSRNTSAQNVVSENGGPDVLLVENANSGVPAPVLSSFSSSTRRFVGTAAGSGIVELFAAQDGAFYGSAHISASPFTVDLANPAASVNAQLLSLGAPPKTGAAKLSFTDPNGNTSEFSSRIGRAFSSGDREGIVEILRPSTVRPAGELEAPRYNWRVTTAGIRVGGSDTATMEGISLPNVGAIMFDLVFDSSRLSLESVAFTSLQGEAPLVATLPESFPLRAGAARIAALFPIARVGQAPLADLVLRVPNGSLAGDAVVSIDPVEAYSMDLQPVDLGGASAKVVILAAPPGLTFADFQARHWPPGTPESAIGPMADPDGDGLSNLLEYGLDLDPNVASRSGLPEIRFIPDGAVTFGALAYTRPVRVSDLLYRVLVASTLRETVWTELSVIAERIESDDRETLVMRDSQPAQLQSPRFYYLELSPH